MVLKTIQILILKTFSIQMLLVFKCSALGMLKFSNLFIHLKMLRTEQPGKAVDKYLAFSRYSNHLITGLVRYLNGRCVFSCQMVQYLNGGLKTGLKKPIMVQNVWYSNGPASHVT